MHVELLDIELANLGTLPNGRQFEWEAVGEGEPFLWIEGGPGFPAHLGRPDVGLFAERFKAHLVNAPGCGRSSPPASDDEYDLAGHVTFFDDVRVALGLGPWTVVGHSWGGLVAMAYAAMRPEAVRRLIVIDGYAGGGSVPEDEAEAEREAVFDGVRGQPWFATAHASLLANLALEAYTEQQDVDTFAPAWPLYFVDPTSAHSQPHLERLTRELRFNVAVEHVWNERFEADDHRALAAQIRCPALVIVGQRDFICGPVWARALADAIPGAHLVEIDGVGHLPQYEAPDRFLSAVYSWLDERSRDQLNSKKETPRIA